jgi:hypothetical protein
MERTTDNGQNKWLKKQHNRLQHRLLKRRPLRFPRLPLAASKGVADKVVKAEARVVVARVAVRAVARVVAVNAGIVVSVSPMKAALSRRW